MTTARAATVETRLAEPNPQRYRVSLAEYLRFKTDGFLIVRGLLDAREIAELRQHTEDLMQGTLPEQRGNELSANDDPNHHTVLNDGIAAPPAHLTPLEKAQFFLRVHMLHRKLALHERYLLHPRVLDVLEVLIGPDVLALQSMLFLKPPGKHGQGWHQDSYYIPTHPDTLCGSWIAIDDADERNGAVWFAAGSQAEPVYPPCPESGYGFGDKLISDIPWIKGASDADERNALTPVAAKYHAVIARMKAGDVAFFGGHVLHQSLYNWTTDRFRRSVVCHYCNARSFTQWGAPKFDENGNPAETNSALVDPETGMTNANHILARGDTHLPFAKPRFGTPCAALLSKEERTQATRQAKRMIASLNNGLLGCAIADPTTIDDHDDIPKPGQGGGY